MIRSPAAAILAGAQVIATNRKLSLDSVHICLIGTRILLLFLLHLTNEPLFDLFGGKWLPRW